MVAQAGTRSQYFFQSSEGNSVQVCNQRRQEAARIDSNGDGVCDRQEIADYLEANHKEELGCHGHVGEQQDMSALVDEYSHRLSGRASGLAKSYHSYDQVSQDMDKLVAEHPDQCEKVSLGQTHEGRDVWALHISDDISSEATQAKPGVMITGCHHAREWMSVEIPLYVAHELLEKPEGAARTEKADVWVVPVVNPDGYEYSRNEDSWWRKNRRPVEHDAVGNPTDAIGVDPNRNHYDGNPDHMYLYRPPGDEPGSTADDSGVTSDNPSSDCYRGPSGASESEIQAVRNLVRDHKNIRGANNYHSYGNTILYPWSYTSEAPAEAAFYRELGDKMNGAMGNAFTVQQSAGLYPSTGDADDFNHVNGVVSYTFEVGKSFQPAASKIQPMCEQVSQASLTFIDEIVARAEAGTLPQRA